MPTTQFRAPWSARAALATSALAAVAALSLGAAAPAWWAVLAPARTPPDILARMNDALNKAMKTPDLAKRLDAQGIDVVGGTPEAARVFIERQMDVWGKVVKDNNIKAD